MDEASLEVREQHFIEEIGLLFSEMGAARMMGRILGLLLVCDPPHQSASQIADRLDASAGSISTTTRQLVVTGMIQKVAVPGERATFFRVRDGMWVDMMRRRLAFLTLVRENADRGLELLADAPASHRRRLQEFRDFYAFMEAETPKLLDAWIAHHEHDEEA